MKGFSSRNKKQKAYCNYDSAAIMRCPVLLCPAVLLALLCLLASGAGLPSVARAATNLLVEPMTVEDNTLKPGETATVTVQVRNTNTQEAANARLLLIELDQNEDGTWKLESPQGEPGPRSCRQWVTLPTDRLTIPPMATQDVPLEVQVPRKARGGYHAMLLVRSDPQVQPGQIPLVVQFAVPLLFSVRGGSAPPNGAVQDAGVEVDKDGQPLLWCSVQNDSESLAKASGVAVLYSTAAGRLRRVGQVDFQPRRILPGNTVKVRASLDKALAGRTYLVKTRMQLDSRRLRPFETEVDLAALDDGPPTIAVTFAPELLELDVPAGGRRGETLRLLNTQQGPVTVSFLARPLPFHEDDAAVYDASSWIEVQPKSFTLDPMRSQNVRVTVSRPGDSEALPFFYATLTAVMTAQNGQLTANRPIPVIVGDKAAGEILEAYSLAPPELAKEDDGWVARTTVANKGQAHHNAVFSAQVLDTSGKKAVQRLEPEPAAMPLFPGQRTALAAPVAVEALEPGFYSLSFSATAGSGKETATLSFEVIEVEGARTVRMVE